MGGSWKTHHVSHANKAINVQFEKLFSEHNLKQTNSYSSA